MSMVIFMTVKASPGGWGWEEPPTARWTPPPIARGWRSQPTKGWRQSTSSWSSDGGGTIIRFYCETIGRLVKSVRHCPALSYLFQQTDYDYNHEGFQKGGQHGGYQKGSRGNGWSKARTYHDQNTKDYNWGW